MINLRVDEAYAFDYLSILDIKKEFNEFSKENWIKCYNDIESQISKNKMEKIISSLEYLNLLEANILTFNLVNKAKTNLVTAKEVHKANDLRYKRKLELQTKFFDNKLSESKF
jgi:hypothetical protein